MTGQAQWYHPRRDHPASVDFPEPGRVRTVACPYCDAPPGAYCVTATGHPNQRHHKARFRAWQTRVKSLS